MIVADITSFFAATSGGIKTYYREKARHLPALGVEAHFVVPGEHAGTSSFGGGWLHQVPGPRLPGAAGYRAFGDVGALARVLAAIDPDVIELGSHYVLPQLIAPAARWLRRRGRAVPIVGFYHADYPSTYVEPALQRAPWLVRRLGVAAAWRWVERQHRRYAATLVGSHHIAGSLVAHGVERVRWIGLGIDPEVFAPPLLRATHPAPVFGVIGRLAVEKRIDLVLAAADALHRRLGARLIIAGAGPRAPAVEAFARTRPWVDVRGHLEGSAAVASVLGEVDALIAPGELESFSLACAEAMACATPVLAADGGGNRELIERSGGGLLFHAGDADALLACATRFAAIGDDERAAMGARGRRHVVDDHCWEHVVERAHTVYHEVLCSS